ncbi:MAG: branched-chain amino acid ABC transporter permease, partial [Propionibacteriaceae bacterium]
MKIPVLVTPEMQERFGGTGRLLAIVGGAVLIVSAFLPWSYGRAALDNMTLLGSPSILQTFGLVLGVVIVAFLVLSNVIKPRPKRKRVGWIQGAKAASTGALIYVALILISIAAELGGLINVVYGGWVAFLGALLAFVGTKLMPPGRRPTLHGATLAPWLEILSIAVIMAAALFGAAFALDNDDGGSFLSFLAFAGAVIAILIRTGVMSFLSGVSQRHRKVLILAAFLVAFMFPFTQNGSDANMSIATQVIIFAATAMGLNIVVGLAGLLDLGYIAFLGAGAFTAAILSRSAFSTLDFHPPFIVVVLISGAVSAT